MPAEPQQIACSAGSSALEAGDRVEQLARLDADPLRVGEVARVLKGDAQLERMPLGPRLLRQQLGDVDDAHVEPGVLQMGAAARGVDGDRVDTCSAEQLADGLRPPSPLLPPTGMEMERAAASLARRRDDLVALRRQHARRGGVDVAEDDALHAARQQADPARREPTAAVPRAAARLSAPGRSELGQRPQAASARSRPEGASASATRIRRGCGRPRRRACAAASRPPAGRTALRRPHVSARSAGRSERRTGTRSRTPCSRGSGRCARRRRSWPSSSRRRAPS